MTRYRVVAAVPSMLSLPNSTVTMNHLDDLHDVEATFTTLNMNRKSLPPELTNGAIAVIVRLSTLSIDEAVGLAEQIINIILDQLSILTGTGIGEPLFLYALDIDVGATVRDFVAWDLWNRAPTMHRPWDPDMLELWNAWQEALIRVLTSPGQSKHADRLVFAAHWYRVGLQAIRSSDRFSAFWSALEALDASLIQTAATWAEADLIVSEYREDGQRRSLRGVATLARVVEGDDALFRQLYRFRNDLLHANILPPLALDTIQGYDARAMRWIVEGFQRILGLAADDPLIQRWRTSSDDFRVLGNVRITARGRFTRLPQRFLDSVVEMIPVSFSMTKRGQELLIRYDSRKGVLMELDRVSLWGARQYLTEMGISAKLVDIGRWKGK